MVNVKGKVNFHDLKKTKIASLLETYSAVEEAASGTLSGKYDLLVEDKLDILFTSYNLTTFQKNVVGHLYPVFATIANRIDPEKLTYNVCMNEDQDLLLSRKTDKGLSTLIIHDDELIIHSFISSTDKNSDKFDKFEDMEIIDFEALVYKFLC